MGEAILRITQTIVFDILIFGLAEQKLHFATYC